MIHDTEQAASTAYYRCISEALAKTLTPEKTGYKTKEAALCHITRQRRMSDESDPSHITDYYLDQKVIFTAFYLCPQTGGIEVYVEYPKETP